MTMRGIPVGSLSILSIVMPQNLALQRLQSAASFAARLFSMLPFFRPLIAS